MDLDELLMGLVGVYLGKGYSLEHLRDSVRYIADSDKFWAAMKYAAPKAIANAAKCIEDFENRPKLELVPE